MRGTVEQRFWAKVNKDGPIPAHRPELGPCWVWTANCNPCGYGQMGLTGRRLEKAHRVAWVIAHGFIPFGMSVLHSCDNPPCVRASHLFLGTQADNMADMARKGRVVVPQLNGEQNPRSLLTVEQALQIRGEGYPYSMSAAEWGRRFGVTAATIQDVRTGRSWRHLGGIVRAPSGGVPTPGNVCGRGHSMEDAYYPPSGGRQCRPCAATRAHDRYVARKATA